MEIFDVHRRDILDFDRYMDLKKPGFGGPSSAQELRDQRGNKINKNPKLADYQRTVERDPAFSHQVWDPTYKAMTHDLVYKQEKKKPFTYTDPYLTAVPVVDMEDVLGEGKTFTSFDRFINEAMEPSLSEIERELRSYEEGYDEEESFGSNPEDEDNNNTTRSNRTFGANPSFVSPTGEEMPEGIQKWIASLDGGEIESGANPFKRMLGRFSSKRYWVGQDGEVFSTSSEEEGLEAEDSGADEITREMHDRLVGDASFELEDADPISEPESHQDLPEFYLESGEED